MLAARTIPRVTFLQLVADVLHREMAGHMHDAEQATIYEREQALHAARTAQRAARNVQIEIEHLRGMRD